LRGFLERAEHSRIEVPQSSITVEGHCHDRARSHFEIVANSRAARKPACPAQCGGARFGTPDEVAAAATVLASEDASFITGASLVVDDGWTVVKEST
jgi:NAD(P)-dependent dehydrogenase (short-subunit alcohol dehydrogenase family)